MSNNFKIRGVIFGSLETNFIDIHVGYGYGMNDGGGLRKVNRKIIPQDCLMPNTYVWVTLKDGDVLQVEKMSERDIKENSKVQ